MADRCSLKELSGNCSHHLKTDLLSKSFRATHPIILILETNASGNLAQSFSCRGPEASESINRQRNEGDT